MLAVAMVVTETVNIRLIIFYYHFYHYYYNYHYDDDDVPDMVFNIVTKKPLSFLALEDHPVFFICLIAGLSLL